jgi:hypothetical protein
MSYQPKINAGRAHVSTFLGTPVRISEKSVLLSGKTPVFRKK